eukprot:GHRR01020769.1.p1 GENE.GHRR01020769.1~~GHRR01020769.1.p1  ORF type:complete len:114 (+),score=10.09 GHRR01020769.1:761-1102(+)
MQKCIHNFRVTRDWTPDARQPVVDHCSGHQATLPFGIVDVMTPLLVMKGIPLYANAAPGGDSAHGAVLHLYWCVDCLQHVQKLVTHSPFKRYALSHWHSVWWCNRVNLVMAVT